MTPAVVFKTGFLAGLLAPAAAAAGVARGAAVPPPPPPAPPGLVTTVLNNTVQVWQSIGIGAQVVAAGLVFGVAGLLALVALGMFSSPSSGDFPSISAFRLVDPSVIPDGIASHREIVVEIELAADLTIEPPRTRWLVTEGSIPKPSPDDPRWMSAPPSTYTLSAGDGPKTVNLWLQDSQGVILHASEFLVRLDTITPLDPESVFSTTHQIGETSDNNRVTAQWSPAIDPDPGSGIAGYSIDWSRFSNTVPDPVQDLDGSAIAATSPELSVGTWYMHLSTLDRAGNHTTTVHLGPFIIGVSSDGIGVGVSQPGSGDSAGGSISSGEGAPSPEAVAVDLPQPLVDPPVVAFVEAIPEIAGDPAGDNLPENLPEPDVPGGSGDTGGNTGSSSNDDDDDDDGTVPVIFPPAGVPLPIQPTIGLVITGDVVSAIGEDITYQFQIANNSSIDTPALILDNLFDDLLGDLTGSAIAAGCGTLLAGTLCGFNVDRQVQSEDADPLINSATATYHPQGLPDDVTGTASHSVDLFQPSVAVTVSGDTTAQVGDSLTYQYGVTNTGDGPSLVLDSIIDDLLGDLISDATAAGCDNLASGASCAFDVIRQVEARDPEPLLNVVAVHYHSQGFANDVSDTDSHSVEIIGSSGNSPPLAADDLGIYSVDENDTLSVVQSSGVLVNDIDPDGDPLTAVYLNGPKNGVLTLNADGSFTYTPDANFNGVDSFKYRAHDGTASSGAVNVEITVLPINQSPTANPLSFATGQDTPVDLVLTGSDLETAVGDLGFGIVSQPTSGVLSGSAPDLTYTPDSGFFGSDSFTFAVTDRGDPDNCGTPGTGCAVAQTSAEAEVSIEVSAVSSGLIQDLVVNSQRQHEIDILEVGGLVYTDREYEYTDVPANLAGHEFIRTANDDKNVAVADYLSIRLSEDARVFILYDHRATVLPAWLDDGTWTLVNYTVDTGDVLRRVYFKDFLTGNVQLGGNAMPPMAGAASNYNVVAVPASSLLPDTTDPIISIIFPADGLTIGEATVTVTGDASDDTKVAQVELSLNGGSFETASGTTSWSKDVTLLEGSNTLTARATDLAGNTAEASATVIYQPTIITNLVVSNGETYEIDTLATDKKVYIDRGFKFKQVPAVLEGKDFIRTANADKGETAADFITFDLTGEARVYILYDDRASVLPAWLDDVAWTLDVITQDTTDVLRRVYYQDFIAGPVQLGGNAMPPMSGASSNYNVVVAASPP